MSIPENFAEVGLGGSEARIPTTPGGGAGGLAGLAGAEEEEALAGGGKNAGLPGVGRHVGVAHEPPDLPGVGDDLHQTMCARR